MKKLEKIYEGKAKILYRTENEDLLVQYFKDTATAFNAQKKETIPQKGIYNNLISTKLFELMEKKGIKTHLVKQLNEREMLVRSVTIVPLEVVVRNIAAGSLVKRLGLKQGHQLRQPIIEFYFKDDQLGDPLINEDHIAMLQLATTEELTLIRQLAFRINQVLREFFADLGVALVDLKLEFGRYKEDILLADELSPDVCRLWDKTSGKILDKDRFRQDLGGLVDAYQEVWQRVADGG